MINIILICMPLTLHEVTIHTDVIFRTNKSNICVRHTEVNFHANNLIYWFVGTEVQLACELTVLNAILLSSARNYPSTPPCMQGRFLTYSHGRLLPCEQEGCFTSYPHRTSVRIASTLFKMPSRRDLSIKRLHTRLASLSNR